MRKMSITRGLAELKLLDKRIKKEINSTLFCSFYQEKSAKEGIKGLTNQEFENDVKSRNTSIRDLIKRRSDIKNAILISNSNTFVTVGGLGYTVIEAIEHKNAIEYEKILLEKMKSDFSSVKGRIEHHNIEVEKNVAKMIEANLGSEKKAEKDDYDVISAKFTEKNELKLLDPIKVQKRIDELDKRIDEFVSNIDFVLSESNSKTEIEI